MKAYDASKIRNVSLLGHSSSGKTMLVESLLYATGAISRMGKVEDGNTVGDFSIEEKQRKVSINTKVIPVEYNDVKYNFLDTPGYFDFIGEMYGAKRASEGSILVIDAQAGVEVGTEKAWKNLNKYHTPRFIFLNKMDKENVKFDEVLEEIKTKLGGHIVPLVMPIGEAEGFKGMVDLIQDKAYSYENRKRTEIPVPAEWDGYIEKLRGELNEVVAETSEELMEKFFAGEKFTDAEFKEGIKQAVRNGELTILMVGSVEKGIGMELLLHKIQRYFPAPNEVGAYTGTWKDKEELRKVDANEPFSAVVFKTIVDPFVGKLSLFKVISGKLTKSTPLYNASQEVEEKLGGLFYLRGKTQIDTDAIIAGDIGATSKLEHARTGDTLCDKANPVIFERIRYPKPTLYMSVRPVKQGEDEKIGVSLNKMTAEDPTFEVLRNHETKELLIGGQGNMQLTVIKDKLKNTFGVEIELNDPKIAYRETIRQKAEVQGKHKKQSGGAGQYGDVWVRFEPNDGDDFVFQEEVFGGAVPKNFFPAVEKGLRESLEHGVLAGYPVVHVKATLYDGSYHDVDSNEMAFKIAAQLAFKKGMQEAKPILLEPIVKAEIKVPENYLGDVMGDMNKRRGRILGIDSQDDGTQVITAEVPHSEMFRYAIDLRAMTQARGSFQMDFVRYEEVPQDQANKIIEAANAEKNK